MTFYSHKVVEEKTDAQHKLHWPKMINIQLVRLPDSNWDVEYFIINWLIENFISDSGPYIIFEHFDCWSNKMYWICHVELCEFVIFHFSAILFAKKQDFIKKIMNDEGWSI